MSICSSIYQHLYTIRNRGSPPAHPDCIVQTFVLLPGPFFERCISLPPFPSISLPAAVVGGLKQNWARAKPGGHPHLPHRSLTRTPATRIVPARPDLSMHKSPRRVGSGTGWYVTHTHTKPVHPSPPEHMYPSAPPQPNYTVDVVKALTST